MRIRQQSNVVTMYPVTRQVSLHIQYTQVADLHTVLSCVL